MFSTVQLTKNSDIKKYKYSGYGIGFDGRGVFSFPNGSFNQKVIVFGADMSFSVHANTKKKKYLILGEDPTQGIDDITLTAARKYSINFTLTKKRLRLSLHYNGANSYLFVNGTENTKFKANVSNIVANPLCLGNISKDFPAANMKKARLYEWVYDFSVDYRAIAIDDILDTHKYLMKKNNII